MVRLEQEEQGGGQVGWTLEVKADETLGGAKVRCPDAFCRARAAALLTRPRTPLLIGTVLMPQLCMRILMHTWPEGPQAVHLSVLTCTCGRGLFDSQRLPCNGEPPYGFLYLSAQYPSQHLWCICPFRSWETALL